MRSAIAAMRAFISPRKAQLVLKGQVLERHVTLPGSSCTPGVNQMGIKSAATLSPIPPPRKGKGEIR
jgi:hypothetical protein